MIKNNVLKSENIVLRAALEWYADKSNYSYKYYKDGFGIEQRFHPILDKGFDRARQALSTQSSGAALLEAIRGAIDALESVNSASLPAPGNAWQPFLYVKKALSALKAAMGEK